ncbi:hypothetical protein DF268_28240 [Streptomyces sp. V2]|nr:hypothetical protein DF268_28240 [Streptomyces sp. V2]
MNPGLPEDEVAIWVEHRMRRRGVIEGGHPYTYEAIIHEVALRLRVSDRRAARAQLHEILDRVDQGNVTVRVIPTDQDGFAGSGASMMYAGVWCLDWTQRCGTLRPASCSSMPKPTGVRVTPASK